MGVSVHARMELENGVARASGGCGSSGCGWSVLSVQTWLRRPWDLIHRGFTFIPALSYSELCEQ